MKNQALFSSKDKSKKLKCLLLQFLFGALRIKLLTNKTITNASPWPRKPKTAPVKYIVFQIIKG